MAQDADARDDVSKVIHEVAKDLDPKPNPATLELLKKRFEKLDADRLLGHSEFLLKLATADPEQWAALVQEFLLQLFDLVAQSNWDINQYRDGHSSYEKILNDNIETDIVPRIEAFSAILEDPAFAFRIRALVAAHKSYYLAHAANARLDAEKSKKATRWQDIEIIFLSEERVQIKNGDHVETMNYSDMGFADGRTEKPNQAWRLLLILAQSHGVVRDTSKAGKSWPLVEKGMQKIRKQLRAQFEIDEDPLPFVPGTGYAAVFAIRTSSSFDT